MKNILVVVILVFLSSCNNSKNGKEHVSQHGNQRESYLGYEGISFLGDTLRAAEPTAELVARYKEKKEAFEADEKDLEKIIWHGRFTAYLGNYREAISVYSKAIEMYPDEARLYRHRGHRYITLREIDKAIIDLSRAASLIEGKENQVEEDGMPNSQNPRSELRGNHRQTFH